MSHFKDEQGFDLVKEGCLIAQLFYTNQVDCRIIQIIKGENWSFLGRTNYSFIAVLFIVFVHSIISGLCKETYNVEKIN